MTPYILILYYSRAGSTEQLAQEIAHGVESTGLFEAKIRTVASVSPTTEATSPAIPQQGAPYCTKEELSQCSGLILGSPTRFGNMASALKYFLDQTGDIWASGKLTDKPASCFTSSASLHGGQESTLLTMMIPLLHHGMIYCGLPYANTDLQHTTSGGSPYGATHWQHQTANPSLSQTEKGYCHLLGKRHATLAAKLATKN